MEFTKSKGSVMPRAGWIGTPQMWVNEETVDNSGRASRPVIMGERQSEEIEIVLREKTFHLGA